MRRLEVEYRCSVLLSVGDVGTAVSQVRTLRAIYLLTKFNVEVSTAPKFRLAYRQVRDAMSHDGRA